MSDENRRELFVSNVKDFLDYEPPVLVKIERGEVGFPERNYWIDLDRIKTRQALLQWIHHLTSSKGWITGEHIEQLIEQVYSYRGWEIYKKNE